MNYDNELGKTERIIFSEMIEEIAEFTEQNKGSVFFICNPKIACVLQDSSHFFIIPPSSFKITKVWKIGLFMGVDLFVDSTIPDYDYRLELRLGKGDVRKIIIDNLLNDVNINANTKTLDLSHYKTIIM